MNLNKKQLTGGLYRMKVFIMVDMEGCSGIVASEQVIPSFPDYQEGRRYMTEDTNACVEGCIEGGATEIIVRDAHYMGRNMLWHELSPHARYIQGNSGSHRMPGVWDCDCVILLGYHSMAGTREGILEHTMSPESWQNFWINGKLSGEFAIDAAIAGFYDKPVVMVSGDDKTCAEAEELVPGIVKAQVKKGLSLYGGELLPREKAHELIRKSAAEAVKKFREIKPFKVPGPVTLRLELVSRNSLPSPANKPWLRIIDGRTFEVEGSDFIDAWQKLTGR